ncbi:MAG: ABC transporter ATP-binding protein [Solirubrobacteraceae bacterium]
MRATTRLGSFDLDVDLAVAAGECLALAGPSGAGKSTVLRIAAGIVRPDRGRVACGAATWLDTEDGVDVPPDRRGCGYVFQDYALFPHLRAWENVAFGLRGLRRAERHARALALLERFGLSDRADARPATLSGGERQRVAVARALAFEPSVLLLDEPLSALDSRGRARAARELKRTLGAVEVPTLLVTHDFNEAALLGDEVGVIDAGRIVQRGSAEAVAAEPATAFVADFTGAVVLTGTARPGPDRTAVELDGGGMIFSLDAADGPVAATIYPWEVVLEPAAGPHAGSAQNRVVGEVLSATAVGNRVRVTLSAGQPLMAEISTAAAADLDLRGGAPIAASWKAAATRLVSL